MSGSVVGGIIGAAVGFFIPGVGPALGWMIGSAAGALLFPEQVEGPRLQDFKPQASQYGAPIPIIYSAVISPQLTVIWASDFIEEESESGGCGSPEVTNYAYFANFAVLVCEGVDTVTGAGGAKSLGRIWAGAEKRLIWDGATLEGADQGAEITWYSGTEDQEPDPLIESYLGAGNVPAYRGYAYIVFKRFPLAKDFNRLPFLTIEVGAQAEAVRLGYVYPTHRKIWFHNGNVVLWNWTAGGVIVQQSAYPHAFVDYHAFPIGEGVDQQRIDLDSDTYRLFYGGGTSGNVNMSWGYMDVDSGDEVEGTTALPAYMTDGSLSPLRSIYDGTALYFRGVWMFLAQPAGPYAATLYGIDPSTQAILFTYVYTNVTSAANGGPTIRPVAPADASAGYIMAVGQNIAWKLPIPSLSGYSDQTGVSLGTFTPYDAGVYRNEWAVDTATGYLWITGNGVTAVPTYQVSVHDPLTELKMMEQRGAVSADFKAMGMFYVPSSGKMFIAGVRDFLRDWFIQFDGVTTNFDQEIGGAYHSSLGLHASAFDVDNDKIMHFRYSWEHAVVAETAAGVYDPSQVPNDPVADGVSWYLGEQGASINFDPQSLAAVVSDLSVRAGLTAGEIDVTQLAEDFVDGYAIAQQTDVRSCIAALQPAYWFDGVESGGKIKYVKRGGEIAAEIDDDELGAYQSGSEPVEDLEVTRMMDEELPANMHVRYLLEATNYDPAARLAKRLVGNSGNETTLDLPLVLTDTKAQEIAEVNLHGAWVARLTYRFSLPRKYGYLEPTDLVGVKGRTMRITRIKQSEGRYQVEAVQDDSRVYTPNVVVTETPPPPSTGVETISPTVLELM